MAVARSSRVLDAGHPYSNHPATPLPSQQPAPLGRSRSSSMPAHMYRLKDGLNYNSSYYHYPDQLLTAQSSQPRGYFSPCHLPLNASLDSVLLAPSSTPTVSPSSLSRTPVRSKSGMLVVTDFAPSEGEENVPITVGVLLDANALPEGMALLRGKSEVKLRLVFGRTAVRTDVKRFLSSAEADTVSDIEGRQSLQLKLNAFIPPYAESRFPEQRGVPMSVQVMGGENVIESFTFGMFTYWGPVTIDPTGSVDNFAYTIPPMITTPFHLKRKSEDADLSDIVRPSPRAPAYVLTHDIKSSIVPIVASTLVRLSAAPAEERDGNAEAQEAELEWVVNDRYPDPNSLDKKWTAAENEVGRRLIRFKRDQFGNKLFVSCEIIPEEAYNEDDIVISCIRRPETRNCWFTSVDVIYLLERLVGNPFSTEEKNRIRRNLEGFKPTTVSKHKPGFDAFFQRIMDFPPPKPRNIEKDVKVFPWSVLGNALDKIVQKYSVIPCPPSLNTSPRDSLSGSSSSHEMSASSQFHDGLNGRYSFPNNDATNVHNHEHSEYLHHLIDPDLVHQHSDQFIPDFDVMATSNTEDELCPLQPSQSHFSEDWRRRASIASSMSAASDVYQDVGDIESDRTPFQAFSNPFAENIRLGEVLAVHAVAPDMDGSYNFGHPASASARMSSFPDIHALHLSDSDVRPHVRHSMDEDFVYPPPVHLGL